MATLKPFGLKDILTTLNHSSPLNDKLENYRGNSEFLVSLMEALALPEEQDGNGMLQSVNDYKSETETENNKNLLSLSSYTSIRETVLNPVP